MEVVVAVQVAGLAVVAGPALPLLAHAVVAVDVRVRVGEPVGVFDDRLELTLILVPENDAVVLDAVDVDVDVRPAAVQELGEATLVVTRERREPPGPRGPERVVGTREAAGVAVLVAAHARLPEDEGVVRVAPRLVAGLHLDLGLVARVAELVVDEPVPRRGHRRRGRRRWRVAPSTSSVATVRGRRGRHRAGVSGGTAVAGREADEDQAHAEQLRERELLVLPHD